MSGASDIVRSDSFEPDLCDWRRAGAGAAGETDSMSRRPPPRIKTVALPSGERVPAFGQGTWRMGEIRANRKEEIATLRLGLELGATLIDTAEMYGEGSAEELVGEAILDKRDEVFLVSKIYPHHASRHGTATACEASLRRLKTDRIDLYLLHWRGEFPLEETMEAFTSLHQAGKIRHYGVSNLDYADMTTLWNTPGGAGVAANQVLYNLVRRGIEWDLLPWLRRHRVPVMAYSPIEQARLARNPKLVGFAREHGLTPAQAALSWLLSNDDVIVIPKTSDRDRLKENIHALDCHLTASQLKELDLLFPPPSGPRSLEML
jgi:diketogulonate reductase-like aldo/keto reductase